MRLGKHLTTEEFSCTDGCGMEVVDFRLVMVLICFRLWFRQPVIITSGNRCGDKNQEVVGADPRSKHKMGLAIDFWIRNIKLSEVERMVWRWWPYQYYKARGVLHLEVDGEPKFEIDYFKLKEDLKNGETGFER